MQIREAADYYHISIRTLRYYEELGMLTSKRNESNIRIYEDDQLLKLEEIIVLKMLHLNLKDIQKVMRSENRDCLQSVLSNELLRLDKELHDLQYKRQLLFSLLKTYTASDLSKNKIREFILEQIYLKEHEERMIHMLIDTKNIVFEIGTSLIPLAMDDSDKGLIPSIKRLRAEVKESYDMEFDLIRVRDSIEIPADHYRILQDDRIILERTLCQTDPGTQVDQMITHLKSVLI